MDVALLSHLWESARPLATGLLARYGPQLVGAGALKLRQRIFYYPAPAQAAAAENARTYTAAFGAVLHGLHARGQLTEDHLARAIASPAIADVLERAVQAASLTADAAVHTELAQLVAARLRASDDSTLAITLRDACVKVESLNARHLRALAVVYFAKCAMPPMTNPVGPSKEQIGAILAWIEPRASALGAPNCTFVDASHLDGLHLVKLRQASGRFNDGEYDYSALQQRLNVLHSPGLQLDEHIGAYRWINVATSTSYEYATASRMALTSIGQVLGYTAYCDLIGEEPDFSDFDEGIGASTNVPDSPPANELVSLAPLF